MQREDGLFCLNAPSRYRDRRVPVRCQSYDDQMRCRMKSEGVEITLDGSLLSCRANFTGIIIERFDRREKQQGMLCGPCR